MLAEFLFDRRSVRRQGAGLALPAERPNAVQALRRIDPQGPLHRRTRHVGQFGDAAVRFASALEPEDFHPLLDTRVRVLVGVTAISSTTASENEYVGRILALGIRIDREVPILRKPGDSPQDQLVSFLGTPRINTLAHQLAAVR